MIIILKFEQYMYHFTRVMGQKDADGMAINVDPDQ